jgi:hypothetical protein
VKNRGAILVVLLLGTGLVAAVAAVWNQYRQTHRALAFWGTTDAGLINSAPTVVLINWTGKGAAEGEPADGDGRDKRLDISRVPGLIHFRHSLLEDRSFEWDIELPRRSVQIWDYAVQFSDGESMLVVRFNLRQRLVADNAIIPRIAVLTERTAQGLEQFFTEQLERAAME